MAYNFDEKTLSGDRLSNILDIMKVKGQPFFEGGTRDGPSPCLSLGTPLRWLPNPPIADVVKNVSNKLFFSWDTPVLQYSDVTQFLTSETIQNLKSSSKVRFTKFIALFNLW